MSARNILVTPQVTPQEIVAAAAAMWDECSADGRPRWKYLKPGIDDLLMREMRGRARAGIVAFFYESKHRARILRHECTGRSQAPDVTGTSRMLMAPA